MNMQAVDWAIVIGLLLVLLGGALSTRRYTKSVAAFLAAHYDKSSTTTRLNVPVFITQSSERVLAAYKALAG